MQMPPCQPTTAAMHVFIVIMNVVQTIVLAYIAQRAVRKNREDRNGNGDTVK